MTWLLFALLSPLCWATCNVIDTVLRRRFIRDDYALMFGYAVFHLPLAIIMFALFGFEFPSYAVFLMMLVSGSLWTISFIPYLRAIQIEEPSRVILFLQLLSILTLIFGYFILGEGLDLKQTFAFIVLLSGGFLAGIKHFEGKWRFSGRAFLLMLIASIMWALSDVLFKKLSVDFLKFMPSFTVFLLGSFVPGPLMLVAPAMRLKVRKFWRKLPGRAWLLVCLTIIIGTFGSLFFAYALILGKVALTSVLTDIQPLFVFLLTLSLAHRFKSVDPEDTSRFALLFKGFSFAVILAGLWILYS